MKSKKKIVLAYSGGLDTSIILKWLQEKYNSEVITYTADIGQKINKKKIISNAKKLGVKKIRLTGGEPLVRRDIISLIQKRSLSLCEFPSEILSSQSIQVICFALIILVSYV